MVDRRKVRLQTVPRNLSGRYRENGIVTVSRPDARRPCRPRLALPVLRSTRIDYRGFKKIADPLDLAGRGTFLYVNRRITYEVRPPSANVANAAGRIAESHCQFNDPTVSDRLADMKLSCNAGWGELRTVNFHLVASRTWWTDSSGTTRHDWITFLARPIP